MHNVKFISDLHLGHKAICKYRPEFATVEEHDEFVLNSIYKNINKREVLYLLGDLAFTEEAGDKIVELSKHCILYIVLGNHDTDTSYRRKNIIKYVNAGIRILAFSTYREAWLSHCPIHPQEMRKKLLNIHGHTHNHNIVEYIEDGKFEDPKYFNVSCENIDYVPISYAEILKRTNLEEYIK